MPLIVDIARRIVRGARIRVKSFAYSGPRRERWQHPEQVLNVLAPQQGSRVADIGAGGGYFTLPLARAVGPKGTVYAVDPDSDMTALVADRARRDGLDNVLTIKAPDEDPALPEAVDLALVVNTLHHLPEPGQYAERLAGYVRPGGRVAVIEALPRWFLFGHATDPARIRSLMTDAGYVLVEEHAFLPKQSFQVFRRSD